MSRTHLTTTIAGLTLALLLAAAFGPSATLLEAAPRANQVAANQVAGTWEVHVEPDPQSGIPPVVNFASFTRDGRIVNVDPGLGTAVGEWGRQGGAYAVTFHGFLQTGGQTFHYKVRATLGLDPSAGELAGPFLTEVLDLAGNPITSFEGTVAATRLAVEPY